MQNHISSKELKELIQIKLPVIMQQDKKIREFILKIAAKKFADKEKTEDRIEKLGERIDRKLDELKRDREENNKRWEENNKRLDEKNAEDKKKWEENNKKWEENHEEIRMLIRKIDVGIGALGSRWGLHTEESFRSGLAGILKDSFGVRVERYLDFDAEGLVYGRPEQIELDIIVRNGVMIIAEIKSSMSNADMHTFHKKAKFYEKKHNIQETRKIVISPMVDEKARSLAKELSIEVYSHAEDTNLTESATFSRRLIVD